ncbi:MAG: ABC transporter ATP-binding protein [Cytophagales bacterium]|nr:ABC transporter ATP-binding protein [Cytophagales bacterium]
MKDIIISNISYKVNDKEILNKVSLSVNKGEVFALIGQNGSGKSTLIDIILNDIKPSEGKVSFFEQPKYSFDKIGIVYDHLPLFPLLRTKEVVKYFCTIHKLHYNDIATKYFEIFGIVKILKSLIRELSQGEKKRLSIMLSIIHNPILLVLDEPFANLDPTIIESIWKVLKSNNRTIFFTTHNWKEVEELSDKIGFLYYGRMLSQPNSPSFYINNLPAQKKIAINYSENIVKQIGEFRYYVHDEIINIFFPNGSNLMSKVNQNTNNFSVKDVGLKDAYLFDIYTNNNA